MEIKFYYWEDCPSHEDALERLQEQMTDLSIIDPVTVIELKTEADAQRYQFIGSPTIHINGVDVDPPPPEAEYALNCRVYRHENGRFSPLPSVNMIRAALEKASE